MRDPELLRLFSALESGVEFAEPEPTFADDLYERLRREALHRHSSHITILVAATLVVALTAVIAGSVAVGSGLILPPGATRLPVGPASPTQASSTTPYFGPGPQSVTVGGVRLSFQRRSTYTWESHHRPYITKSTGGGQAAEAVIYWGSFPDGQSATPCLDALGTSVGPSAVDLAAAVATARGTELVAGPSDTIVGDLPAMSVVVKVLDPAYGCQPGFFYHWEPLSGGSLWLETKAADTISVWIIEVEGTRIFIGAETRPDAGTRVAEQIQQIIDSIQIEP